jgi:hypothetical protein
LPGLAVHQIDNLAQRLLIQIRAVGQKLPQQPICRAILASGNMGRGGAGRLLAQLR